jgi:hypothetical protein
MIMIEITYEAFFLVKWLDRDPRSVRGHARDHHRHLSGTLESQDVGFLKKKK